MSKFNKGDKVTWGTEAVVYEYLGTVRDQHMLVNGTLVGTGEPYTLYPVWIEPTSSDLRLAPPRMRTVQVEIDLIMEDGKVIAFAGSDEDPQSGFGDPMPDRIATRIITFEVPA